MTFGESSVRSRELGRRLLSVQERAGFNGLQLAAKLEWSPSTLSRTMSGQRAALDTEVATILGLCGVAGTERDDILGLCRPYQDASLHLSADEHWPVYLAHARDAARMIEFQPVMVPRLLQTPDYTRALVIDGASSESWESAVVAGGMAVQLFDLPRVEVLVHEWALRTPLQDGAMMSDQLHHLIRMSVLPRVSLRVVPIGHGAYAGRNGGFTLLEFADHAPVLYREEHTAGVLLDGPEVAACGSLVDSLSEVALDERRSRDLIGQIAIELYGSDVDNECGQFGVDAYMIEST